MKRDICEICNKNKAVQIDSNTTYTDRKGMWGYTFINYCQKCWEKKIEIDKIEIQWQQKKNNIRKEKRLILQRKMEKLNYEPIPIKEAVIKYRKEQMIGNSDRWIRNYLISSFKNILKIEKIRNRWYCCKNRLELINFEIYNLYNRKRR